MRSSSSASSSISPSAVISATEAMVFTRDNHVGLTRDGGATWGFERMTTGTVWAVAGAPGGPYVVVGGRGFAAISTDGTLWTDLPRYTSDDLKAVAVAGDVMVAVGKNGGFVKVKTDGSAPVIGWLPDKAKATAVALDGGTIRLAAGKRDLARDMLLMLLNSLEQEKSKIMDACENNRMEALLGHVHYLHGATRYCGVPALRDAAHDLETHIKTRLQEDHGSRTANETDTAHCRADLERLVACIDDLIRWREHNELPA